MIKKKSDFIIFVALLVFISFIVNEFVFSSYWIEQRSSKFCEMSLRGELTYCFADKKGTTFTLEGIQEEFWFNPALKRNNQKYFTFCRGAVTGDKIYKLKGDSILYLVNQELDTIAFKFYCP